MKNKFAGYILKAVLAVIVLIILFCFTSWYQTKKELVRYCHETTAGTSLATAKDNALRHGLRFINYSFAYHKAFVFAGGVLGRYVCEIEHDGKKVVKTSLNFND